MKGLMKLSAWQTKAMANPLVFLPILIAITVLVLWLSWKLFRRVVKKRKGPPPVSP